MKTADLFSQLKKQFLSECEWFAFREIKELTKDRNLRNGKVDAVDVTLDHGVFIEVYFEGHFSSSSTRDMSLEGMTLAFHQSLKAAKLASANKVYNFPLSVRPLSVGSYKAKNSSIHFNQNQLQNSFESSDKASQRLSDRPLAKNLDRNSESALFDGMLKLDRALKVSEMVKTVRTKLRTVHTYQHYRSSSGAEWEQDFEILMTDFSATAENSKDSQTRTDSGGLARCHQLSLQNLNFENLAELASQVGSEACELLESENCPTLTCDLILAPDQMMLQIHESIGHPLELDRILGDERNFAGWSFIKPSDFGQLQYGSKLMNVTFDPTVPTELASYAVDETGHSAQREYLIKDGVLQRGLGSLESQLRLNLPGVANARSSSWNRPAIDRMGNINLESGTTSLSDLISKTERGVLMRANRSWSIDDYRDKFQFGCEYAQEILDGKITRTLKNPNYRGRTIEFWNKLKGVGNESEIYGTPFCGKGEPSQLIRVGHASPAALFANVEIFGGGL